MRQIDRVNAPDLKPLAKDWRLKALASCTTKDQTRYHLTGVGLTQGHWFATDGHRMMVVEKIDSLIGLQESERIYDAEHFKKGSLYPFANDLHGKLVDWKRSIPDLSKAKHVIELDLPAWFKDIKRLYRGADQPLPSIYYNELCGWSTSGSKEALFACNLHYLAPLAGLMGVKMYVTDALSAIVFKGCNDEWTYVLMPMRK